MNVLYLLYDGLTDSLGRSQVLPYILGLTQKGHTFTIVSFEKNERFERDKDNIQKIVNDSGINWIPLNYTSTPPVFSTIYDVYQLGKTAKKLHLANPFDIVHCRSYITSIVGLDLKRMFGVKFVFDMRAFYADERVDGKLWDIKNPIFKQVYNYFKRKEIEFLSEADYSVSLTEKGRKIIHEWETIANQPVPIEVIPCCADLEHFHPSMIDVELKSELQKRFQLNNDDFVITYLGSIGTWYLLDEMLDFFNVLKKKKPNLKFLFITTDNPNSILEPAKAKEVDLDSILISPAKREEVPTFLSLANAAIFFIQPVFSKSGSSPTKHGEMLGMGLPVIANAGVGDVDSIITDTNSGILINEFTQTEYEKAVSKIDELLEIPTKQLQAAAKKYYSLEEGVTRYNTIYDRISA